MVSSVPTNFPQRFIFQFWINHAAQILPQQPGCPVRVETVFLTGHQRDFVAEKVENCEFDRRTPGFWEAGPFLGIFSPLNNENMNTNSAEMLLILLKIIMIIKWYYTLTLIPIKGKGTSGDGVVRAEQTLKYIQKILRYFTPDQPAEDKPTRRVTLVKIKMLLHMLVWLFVSQVIQERQRQLNWRSVFTEHEMATLCSNSGTHSKVSFPRQECPDVTGRGCNYSISIPHKNAKINTASTYASLSTHTTPTLIHKDHMRKSNETLQEFHSRSEAPATPPCACGGNVSYSEAARLRKKSL